MRWFRRETKAAQANSPSTMAPAATPTPIPTLEPVDKRDDSAALGMADLVGMEEVYAAVLVVGGAAPPAVEFCGVVGTGVKLLAAE